MTKKFYIILIAQFLSALADNALLFTAIALLAAINAPEWHTPLLQQFFVVSYILLAPFVGSIADAFPKGSVMFFSNMIKVLGCGAMIFGMPPLYAYGIVGIGAAAYSPAKYGILTELLPSNQLVAANGWMEGSTVTAIIFGAILGGMLATNNLQLGMWIIGGLYLGAAIFNYYIPKLPIDHKLEQKSLFYILKDFLHAFLTLWKDPLGQVSLAVTTLFWGAGATLRLVVLMWAAVILNFSIEQSTQLIAMVAVGIAVGSIVASRYITL
jgi:MFS transporter, LPLT family, lysophospholipid transporter